MPTDLQPATPFPPAKCPGAAHGPASLSLQSSRSMKDSDSHAARDPRDCGKVYPHIIRKVLPGIIRKMVFYSGKGPSRVAWEAEQGYRRVVWPFCSLHATKTTALCHHTQNNDRIDRHTAPSRELTKSAAGLPVHQKPAACEPKQRTLHPHLRCLQAHCWPHTPSITVHRPVHPQPDRRLPIGMASTDIRPQFTPPTHACMRRRWAAVC